MNCLSPPTPRIYCWTRCRSAVLKKIRVFDVSLLSVLTKSLLCMKGTPSGLRQRQQTFFASPTFFSEPHIHRSVKNGKKKNMVACLTGLLCSLAPLYILPFFEQKGISFLLLSFFLPLLPFLFLLRLFCARRPLLLPRQRV